jgi:hypothetical protein
MKNIADPIAQSILNNDGKNIIHRTNIFDFIEYCISGVIMLIIGYMCSYIYVTEYFGVASSVISSFILSVSAILYGFFKIYKEKR